jgi:hypothetical protein
MSRVKADFQPVLPNITDDSMREVDVDMENIGRKNESIPHETSGGETGDVKSLPKNKLDPKLSDQDQQKSTYRKIAIGILIVIIVVLVIILIYQIYNYYNTTDICMGMSNPTSNDSPDPLHTGVIKDTTESQSTPSIPAEVMNLDNDVLSQYIKKSDNATQQRQKNVDTKWSNNAVQVGLKSMIGDVVPQNIDNSEMVRISKIIDETQDSQNEETYSNNDDIPSREDVLQQMHKDMDDDKDKSASLQSIEEEYGDNVIDDFLVEDDDDFASIKSEDECQFEITKGKNKGQICGRKRIGDNCGRHKYK